MSVTPCEVILFTDGACSGNPGPGGWAYLLRDIATGTEKRVADAERDTTNNRMELTAVIRGLEALKRPCKVEVVTDSAYVAEGIASWMQSWKRNGWQRREGNRLKPVKNVELWQRLDELTRKHTVTVRRIRGHAGHAENEVCDQMAVAAYQALLGTSIEREGSDV